MKKNKPVENTPLLYIVQPKLNTITTNMQQAIFITKTKEADTKPKPPKAEKELKQEVRLDPDTGGKKKKKLKQFQEMTLEEQVTFLLNLPSKLQSIQCVIATKNGKYYGSIVEYQNEWVKIQQSNSTQVLTVKITEIEKITIVDVKD